jgi:hypothetical protein
VEVQKGKKGPTPPKHWQGPYTPVETVTDFVNWIDRMLLAMELAPRNDADESDGRIVWNAYRLVAKLSLLDIPGLPPEPTTPLTIKAEKDAVVRLRERLAMVEKVSNSQASIEAVAGAAREVVKSAQAFNAATKGKKFTSEGLADDPLFHTFGTRFFELQTRVENLGRFDENGQWVSRFIASGSPLDQALWGLAELATIEFTPELQGKVLATFVDQLSAAVEALGQAQRSDASARTIAETGLPKDDTGNRHGIEVNRNARTICHAGKPLDLSTHPVLWHVFIIAFDAMPNAYTLADINANYPGEQSGRHQAKSDLNTMLAKINLTITRGRQLRQITD